MELNEIKHLLDKYEAGETSLQEESVLRKYFTQEVIHPELEPYQMLFTFFDESQKERSEVTFKAPKRSFKLQWSVAAASVVLFVSMFTLFNPGKTSIDALSEEDRVVYEETLEALELLSVNFNKGIAQTSKVSLINEHFNKGKQLMSHSAMFSQTTNKLLINK